MTEKENSYPVQQFQHSSASVQLPQKRSDGKEYTPKGLKMRERLLGKTYSGRNYFAEIDSDPEKDLSRIVYDMGMEYYAKIRDRKIRRSAKHPANLIRYLYLCWLSGRRIADGTIKPYPKLTYKNYTSIKWPIMLIDAVNTKHFNRDGSRIVYRQYMPIFNEVEKKMWSVITNSFQDMDLRELYTTISEINGTKRRTGNLTHAMQNAFRHDMRTPGGRLLKGAKVSPHSLRHMRVYSLKHQHGLTDENIRLIFGWNKQDMVYYYEYLSESIKAQAQLDMLKKIGSA